MKSVILSTLTAGLLLAAFGTAHAGVATGTLSLSIRIVDSCDVHTELPGQTYPSSSLQAPRSRSICNAGVPAPRVTTTALGAPSVVMPPARGQRAHGDKGRTVKIVTIYF